MKDANTLFIPAATPYPNSALPVLIYPQVTSTPDFTRLFAAQGWTGIWVNGVYSFHHFHTTAHEALGCQSGWARLRLGGPEGVEVRVTRGDALLLPAGVAHQLLAASPDFSIVGAYPRGQSPDLHRGKPADYERLAAACRALPLPETDPVQGAQGAVGRHWHQMNGEG
ncbi:MAG: cupin [Clostridiales bacterium]|nr:cupin [Clostridiales bacterium]